MGDAPTFATPPQVPRGQDGAAAAAAGYSLQNRSLPHPHALAGSLEAHPQQPQQHQQQHHEVLIPQCLLSSCASTGNINMLLLLWLLLPQLMISMTSKATHLCGIRISSSIQLPRSR